MIHNKFRYLLTLVALIAISTGAWAQATFDVKEITADMVPADWNGDNTIVSPADLATLGITFFEVTKAQASAWADYPTEGTVRLLYAYSTGFSSVDWAEGTPDGDSWNFKRNQIYNANATSYRYFVTVAPAAPDGPEVTPGEAANTWTFSMPGSDVVLTPQYAPAAQWATESNVELLPTAAEGVIAGTDAPLIVEGTVAAGQGTVMYFATTEQLTAEQAAQANGWLSTLPTAANIADDGATVYVWYYIKGADTPDGQEATAENTFNDSEICAQPLEVIVLSNKFDITFNAANANTIEGQNGKGTVTVKTGDAEAVDKTADIDAEHKLKAVKMGSTVTINTKPGYIIRKATLKKTVASANTITIGDITLDVEGCETWQNVIEKNSEKISSFDSFAIKDNSYSDNQSGVKVLKLGDDFVVPSNPLDLSKTYTWTVIVPE